MVISQICEGFLSWNLAKYLRKVSKWFGKKQISQSTLYLWVRTIQKSDDNMSGIGIYYYKKRTYSATVFDMEGLSTTPPPPPLPSPFPFPIFFFKRKWYRPIGLISFHIIIENLRNSHFIGTLSKLRPPKNRLRPCSEEARFFKNLNIMTKIEDFEGFYVEI